MTHAESYISRAKWRASPKGRCATRTMDTEVDVPNPSLMLIPGMYAEVNLTLDTATECLRSR